MAAAREILEPQQTSAVYPQHGTMRGLQRVEETKEQHADFLGRPVFVQPLGHVARGRSGGASRPLRISQMGIVPLAETPVGVGLARWTETMVCG